jgi:hypothetical protein
LNQRRLSRRFYGEPGPRAKHAVFAGLQRLCPGRFVLTIPRISRELPSSGGTRLHAVAHSGTCLRFEQERSTDADANAERSYPGSPRQTSCPWLPSEPTRCSRALRRRPAKHRSCDCRYRVLRLVRLGSNAMVRLKVRRERFLGACLSDSFRIRGRRENSPSEGRLLRRGIARGR